MTKVFKVSVSEIDKVGILSFLSPEEIGTLLDSDKDEIKLIDDGFMPGGLVLAGASLRFEGPEYKSKALFAPWSGICDLAHTDKFVSISVAGYNKDLVIEVNSPLIAKGLFMLIGWHVKRFFEYPKFESVKTTMFNLDEHKGNAILSGGRE